MEIINTIKKLCKEEKIRMTDHALKRCTERNIDIIKDIVSALMSGEIIEEYPEDYPFMSYLVFGLTQKKNPLHVVCAIAPEELWIITAYFPNNKKWENDFKTRKVM